ncbi:MAG: N-acetylmuramoyl-L-alanine amidase [Deferribacterales bacterium]
MIKRLLAFLIFLFLAIISHASLQDDFNNNMKDYNFIKRSKNVTRLSYKMVADKFYEIYQKSPKSKIGEQALYYCSDTYYNSYKRFNNSLDRNEALKYYKLLSSNFKSNLAAKAYLKIAEIYLDMKDIPSARFALQTLINKFPKTKYATDGKIKLDNIDKQYASVQKSKPEKTDKIKVVNKKDKTLDNKADHVDKKADAAEDINSENNAPRVEIKSVKYWSNDDYTRIVIELSGKAHYYKHWLKENPEFNKPPRLFIDIYNSVIDSSIPKVMEINDGLLKALRWGIYDKYTTRVVLDIDSVNDFTVFMMDNPYRIVVDVSKDSLNKVAKSTDTKKTTPTKQTKGKVILDDDVKGHTLASAFGLKIKTIVLDPGHGGKDPGATYHGLMEKDINLDIALRVKKLLSDYDSGLKVLLTRETNVFIPLEERTAFANKNKADIFVSIHQNASKNPYATGIETYVLNVTKDKAALAVAAFENQASEKSISDLQGILKDIMLNSKLEESLMLANFVQKRLVESTGDKNLGVKQAPFYVLVGAKMPSILIECGFISNQHTAQLYTTEEYKNKMAEGIFRGLLKYIEHYNGK